MKLIHTADLHLDAPFSYLPSFLRKQRRESLRNAFQKIIGISIDEGIEILLIAGDLFDSHKPPIDTTNFVLAELKKLEGKNINVYLIPGNHDFLNEDSVYKHLSFPDFVHIFNEDQFNGHQDSLTGAVIYGVACSSFKSEQNILESFQVEDSGKLNIGLLHGSLDYGFFHGEQCFPFKAEEFTNTGLDYLALGHYHNSSTHNDQDVMAYAGTPSGLNFTETGERVALKIELEKEKHNLEKIVIDNYIYQVDEIDCSDFQTTDQVKTEISRKANSTIFQRFILKGSPPLEFIIDQEKLVNEHENQFAYVDIIEDFSFPKITGYEKSRTIKSLFIKEMQKKIENASGEEKKIYDLAARLGISAIEGTLD